MATNILMPALSPTMEQGKLAKWLKKEGDAVRSGDILAEIETDKATMEVEAVDEGTLAKILVPDGTDNVAVNTPIAVIAADGEDAASAPRQRRALPAAAARQWRERAAAEAPQAGRQDGRAASHAPRRRMNARRNFPAGTAMVTMTVREALRDAMAEEMRRDPSRLRHGRGGRRISGRLQDHAGACCRNSATSASSTRRSPNMASPASASAPRWRACARSSNS